MPLEGEMAHCGGDICELCVLLAKSLSRVSFLFPPERTLVINGYTKQWENIPQHAPPQPHLFSNSFFLL